MRRIPKSFSLFVFSVFFVANFGVRAENSEEPLFASFRVFGGSHPGIPPPTLRRSSRRRDEVDSFVFQHARLFTSSATTGFEIGSVFLAFFRGQFNCRILDHLR